MTSPPRLTQRMQPLIDAIGYDATVSLVAALGGTRIYVSCRPDSPVAAIVGAEASERLRRAVGQEVVDLPRCLHWLLGRRNEEIVARSMAGETQEELARRFRITERHVRRVLRAEAVATPEKEEQT
jgi:hypothetical protein